MLTIDFYSSNKRVNSTKIPTDGAVLRLSGEFREPCDVTSPTVTVDYSGIPALLTGFDYAYIADFRRYYHITRRVVISSSLAQISMACDVLATYRETIAETENYISRASAQWDGHVIDSLQPTSCEVLEDGDIQAHDYAAMLSQGVYVVGIVSPGSASLGSVTHYVMTDGQIRVLINTLYNTDGWISDIDDVSSQLAKAIVNPMQYITSVEWFPYPSDTAISATISKIGQFDIPSIPCLALSPSYGTKPAKEITLRIPKHPQITSYMENGYLQSDFYSTYTLRAAPFGEITIPCNLLYGMDEILLEVKIDFITGVAMLTGWARGQSSIDSTLVFSTSAKISISINLSQVINSGMANTFRNMQTSTGGLISGAIGMGIDAIVSFRNRPSAAVWDETFTPSQFDTGMSGIVSAMSLAKNELKVSGTSGGGGMGSLFAYGTYFWLRGRFTKITEFLDMNTYGRPLCKTASPAAIGSGFFMMASPRINISGTPQEAASILEFMRGGFFYE